jgi:hypothetical protein
MISLEAAAEQAGKGGGAAAVAAEAEIRHVAASLFRLIDCFLRKSTATLYFAMRLGRAGA